jgi:hypothetical protein
MASLDIIELIEKNPISKLTNTYNVKLLNKIKTNFSETEQQLFIATFYCYLNYDTKKDFVVDLDNVWKWMGFSQKINTIQLLEAKFILDIDYKKSAFVETKADLKEKKNGGHNIKKVMMTIKCFKSLCLKSQTKKASEIHEYYMKMEEMLHEVIEEEGTELKKQMEEQKYIMNQQVEKQKRLLDQKTEELKLTPELEKHRVLLQQYGQVIGSIIYIVRIKQCDQGKYIIKIGESRKGIKNRFNEFKQKYGSQVLILDCFSVHDSAGFEKFLHHHSEIHPHQIKNLEGHETEQELFMMGCELTYQRLIQIIETGITTFNNPIIENERLKLENEQLRTQSKSQSIPIDHNILQEILKTNQLLLNKIQGLEATNKDIISRLNAMQTKTTTVCSQPDPHIGPRLQKIHPESLTLLHVYETVTECIKENQLLKRPSINKAIKENTIYHGFRWQLVDRELNPNIIYSINPTKITKVQKNGYIAKVNKEQTEILNIYLDRKTAARYNDYPCISSLDNVVKHHTLKDDHYYQLYEECEVVLQNKWKNTHGNIILYHDGIGQYDINNILIAEFTSRFNCTVKAGISQKSLAKILDNDIQYKNSYFKSIGEKLFI